MKTVETTITVVDEMPGRVIPYTISEANAPLIMQSLAKLYSDSARAVAREYSTNADDSHKEAGNPNPIDVTLPSALHPYFTVKDEGVGMSTADLEETYTTFGDSTRRESNLFNGSWGYGAKAALAYTNSFTVTAIKNGLQSVGVVTRRENGAMELKLVLEDVPTNAVNGVTIQVPIHNINEFNDTALKFYAFWKDGTVLIDGVPNINTVADFNDQLDDNMYRSSSSESFVVQGNVAYPVANPVSLFPSQAAYIPFVAYVDNQTVQFTPAREALDYTDYTRAALQGIVDHYIATVHARAEKEVTKAKTPWEALAASRKWSHILNKKFKYKNAEIPGDITFMNAQGNITNKKCWQVNRHWNPVYSTARLDLDNTFIVITNATTTVGTYHRERLRRWCSNKARSMPNYVYFLLDDDWTNDWVDPKNIVSWETIKAETPPPPRAKAGTRVKGTFDMMLPDGTRDLERDPSGAKYWAHHTWIKELYDWSGVAAACGITDDVVIVPANRLDKFRRDYPGCINVTDFLKTQVDLDGNAMYTSEQRSFFNLPYYDKNLLMRMDETKIDDPDFVRLIKLSKRKDIEKPKEYETNRVKAAKLGLQFKPFVSDTAETSALHKNYILIDWSDYYRMEATKADHTYCYINAVYKARLDGTL